LYKLQRAKGLKIGRVVKFELIQNKVGSLKQRNNCWHDSSGKKLSSLPIRLSRSSKSGERTSTHEKIHVSNYLDHPGPLNKVGLT
jgi:hypothetical protein